MNLRFPNLLSPLSLGQVTLRNRIVVTGHHTHLAHLVPNDDLIAYQEARARGGAGLVITEVVGVHETALFSNDTLMALDEACIEQFSRLAGAVHDNGAAAFAQLFHPGREILGTTTGLIPAAYAPSAVPNERFHIMPRELPNRLIDDIIIGFGRAAGYLAEAGYDGVEIVANQGYLPSQFLNPHVNLRNDYWGGDSDRRQNFIHAVAASVRATAPDLVLGLRISGDELDEFGLDESEIVDACEAFAAEFDYFSVVCGTSSGLGASVHIAPPMGIETGYTAPYAEKIKRITGKPVIATGRINQPQTAEAIIAAGQADLCGMTRAAIADPDMPNKAMAGDLEGIRACIACNQSCIGRGHKGYGISCIQNPVSGRERYLSRAITPTKARKVAVIGGGPAGMKAAIIAAERGNVVTLFEKSNRLGGQVLLAQRLPGREEFGGIITNFEVELERAGVRVETGVSVDRSILDAGSFDDVVLATGAVPYIPPFDGDDAAHAVSAWSVIDGSANVGSSAVIADWRSDWIGLGLAEMLAKNGTKATLCVNGAMAGETLQLYTRNHYVGRLHRLGVDIRTHARFYGGDENTAYFQDTLTQEAIMVENIDTIVLALGHRAVLPFDIHDDLPFDVKCVGDCVAPRTAEEAIYEGFMAGREVGT